MNTKFRVSLLLLAAALAQAAEPPISSQALGETLGYPPESIRVTDITEESNRFLARKNRPLGISAHSYKSDDGSFAPIVISVSSGGSLLTPEHKDHASKMIAGNFPDSLVREINKEGLGSGYTGVAITGPGGGQVMSLVNFPSLNLDVQTTISISSDKPVKAGTETYDAQLRSPMAAEWLEKLAFSAGETLLARSQPSPTGSPAPPDSPNSANGNGSEATGAATESRVEATEAAPVMRYLLIGAGVLVALVIGLAIKRSLKNR